MFAEKLCSLSDEDLLQQYRSTRNPKAFREIYQRYRDPLFRYCAQMNLERCNLLMEEFWLTLLQEPPSLHGQRLKNWLYTRLHKVLNTVDPNVKADGATESPLQSAVESSDVLSAVQQLPRRQRNIFLLFNECKLSLATIADIERISLSVCRQELAHGRQSVAFNLHGSVRKPWKSSITLAKEAAEMEAAAQVTTERAEAPRKSRARFPWSPRKSSDGAGTGNPTTANSSVEAARA
ncbi:sigma-70 family RNA polymerase sigma factor [Microbulbifer elongatus]|uniref:Sigma-70 family RNA polymerase sigma factor n=1 Tax=Microbulbifer elongatus TaxID=86173 RepID=A0ABT1NYF8_9GAMM|nr:sigma-70 family RNA polymerase sigma factor [Microbulbifer elongatus]MCQ3827821.1 sigma-70 family RNA polymerase sigma factor [Microbulbifer elongatus]